MTRYMLLALLVCALSLFNSGCEEVSPVVPDDTEIDGTQTGGSPDVPGEQEKPGQDLPEGFEEEPDDPKADVVKTLDYSMLAKAGHPRLLSDAQGFAELKAKVTVNRFQNPTLYKLHSEVLNRAKKILQTDRAFAVATDHYIIVDNLLSCAYAYKLTGQNAYLSKIIGDLTKVCGFANWDPYGLAIGEISMAVGLIYDWLYYDLTLDIRKMARKALVDKGINPMYRNSTNVNIIGNWNQINLGGVSVAAMAVYEKDKTNTFNLLEKALAGNLRGVKGIYYPDGNYAEGLGYWEYGGGYQACFLSCLKGLFGHTAGISEVEGFMDSGEYAMFMHGTMNTTFSYNDGGPTTDPFLLTSWWFAAQKNDPTLIYCEKRRLDDKEDGAYKDTPIDGSEQPYRLLAPMVVMLRDFDIPQTITPPTREVWSGRGEKPVVMVRRGWNFDGNDVFLGVMGGLSNSWNTSMTAHAHMDAGAFVFEAEGVRWSDDMMRPGYGAWYEAMRNAESPRKYTVQNGVMWDTFQISNLCHSTIVSYTNDGSVAGKLHSSDYYVDGFASLDKVIDDGGRQGAEINMTAPMKGQVKSAVRTVELVNGTDLVVTDEITALEELDCALQWRMLSISSSSEPASSGMVLTKNGRTRTLTVSSDDPSVVPDYRKWTTGKPSGDGWGVLDYAGSVSNRVLVGWSVTVPAGKTVKFITTLKK